MRFVYGTDIDGSLSPDIAPSCFSGFPFAPLPGTGPLATTIQIAARWWWQVKNWKFESSCTYTDTGGTTYSFPTTNLVRGSGNATVETDLCIARFADHDFGYPNPAVDPIIRLLLFDTGEPGEGILNFTDPDYYPGIFIQAGLGNNPDGAGFSTDPTGAMGSLTGMLDGLAIPIYYIFGPGTFTPGTFILTPIEFWPYDP